MQVCQDLLNQYEAEGYSSLDRTSYIVPVMSHGVTTTSQSQNSSMEIGKGDPSGFPETQTNHQLQPVNHHAD